MTKNVMDPTGLIPAISVMTLNDWLWQPVRPFERAEAARIGCSVRQLRLEFVRQFNLMVKGFAHERWVN
jgi:hypothetical protein